MEFLVFQTIADIRVFQIFKNHQSQCGSVFRTIRSTEIALFFRALGIILTLRTLEMKLLLRNGASPEGYYSARFELLTQFLLYLKPLYVA